MKIKSLEIDGVGGIGHLEVSFGYGMNVICGANGIGKTTILAFWFVPTRLISFINSPDETISARPM